MTRLVKTRVTQTSAAPPLMPRTPAKLDAILSVVAAGVAALAWACARVAGVELVVRSRSGTSQVNLVSVVVVSLLVAVAGAGLLMLLERRTPQGRRVWTVVAIVIWALSFVGPLSATRLSTGLVLAVLHLLVGAVVIVGLRRSHAADPVSAASRLVA